jgi:rubrerythrin
MDKSTIDTWAQRSRALDLEGIPWDDVRRIPLGPDALRTLRYMQDIESHTVVYVRQLLATRAIDDPDVSAFLACWFYEETFHGRALARLLTAAGETPLERRRSRRSLASRIEERLMGAVARTWPDFVAVHMVWGAINELTTLAGYQRLAELEPHPVLVDLLGRIIRDESRHFSFYYHQAERRLDSTGARRVARFLVDRFWAPVGSGVQPDPEVRFLAGFLFGGAAGLATARKIDATIRRLPGFDDVALVEAWLERETCVVPARRGQPRTAGELTPTPRAA